MILTAFDPEGLWMKARLFLNRAMDDDREFEEQAFWAAAALELLGKAALAKVSPLLIANPDDDGSSFLIASGLSDKSGQFHSVQAKTIWSRCARAFKPFNEAEAKKIALGRNDYVHSAKVGFDAIPDFAWWPRFWAQVVILVEHQDKTIVELVGQTRSLIVEQHLATNQERRANHLQAVLEKARTRLKQFRLGQLPAKLAMEWAAYSQPSWRYTETADCPACESVGQLGGDEKAETRISYDGMDPDDPYDTPTVWFDIEVWGFSCPVCHLEMDDWDLLNEAGFDETFEVQGDFDDVAHEYEYNNE